jgi:hypothetical protein
LTAGTLALAFFGLILWWAWRPPAILRIVPGGLWIVILLLPFTDLPVRIWRRRRLDQGAVALVARRAFALAYGLGLLLALYFLATAERKLWKPASLTSWVRVEAGGLVTSGVSAYPGTLWHTLLAGRMLWPTNPEYAVIPFALWPWKNRVTDAMIIQASKRFCHVSYRCGYASLYLTWKPEGGEMEGFDEAGQADEPKRDLHSFAPSPVSRGEELRARMKACLHIEGPEIDRCSSWPSLLAATR